MAGNAADGGHVGRFSTPRISAINDIGIAMGGRGTDVAREAAALVTNTCWQTTYTEATRNTATQFGAKGP